MDYTKLTLAELANGIVRTETAIRWCREILDDLQEPKTMGMQAVVEAIRDLLPKLEEDLKALDRAYTNAKKRKRQRADLPSPQWFRKRARVRVSDAVATSRGPPLAKIRPGRPAPAMGPGTATAGPSGVVTRIRSTKADSSASRRLPHLGVSAQCLVPWYDCKGRVVVSQMGNVDRQLIYYEKTQKRTRSL
jgi:hypothetical protein